MLSGSEDCTDPGPSGPGQTGQNRQSKLFLGGLSWDTSTDKLREHFEKYGELIEVVVMKDKITGRPRGFGFVTFESSDAAEEAVKDTHMVDGRQIDVKKSVPQEGKPKACKVFVGGLSPETTEDDLKEYFSKFGEIAEVQIMQDHMSGRSRGFGFTTFEDDISASKVFDAGTMHEILGKQVEIKPATPKGSGSLRQSVSSSRSDSDVPSTSNRHPGVEYDPLYMRTYGGNTGMTPGPSGYPYPMYSFPSGIRPGTVMQPMQYGAPLQYHSMHPPPQYLMMHPSQSAMPPSYPSPAPSGYHPHSVMGPTYPSPPSMASVPGPSTTHQLTPPSPSGMPHSHPFTAGPGMYPSSASASPFPPYHRPPGSSSHRSQVKSSNNSRNKDSASSLDAHAAMNQLSKLNLD